jgi:hypothetical protein
MWAASKLAIKADFVSLPRTKMHVKLHKQITVDGGQQQCVVTIKPKSILTPASLHAHITTHSPAKGMWGTHIDLELIHHVQKLWDVRRYTLNVKICGDLVTRSSGGTLVQTFR